MTERNRHERRAETGDVWSVVEERYENRKSGRKNICRPGELEAVHAHGGHGRLHMANLKSKMVAGGDFGTRNRLGIGKNFLVVKTEG